MRILDVHTFISMNFVSFAVAVKMSLNALFKHSTYKNSIILWHKKIFLFCLAIFFSVRAYPQREIPVPRLITPDTAVIPLPDSMDILRNTTIMPDSLHVAPDTARTGSPNRIDSRITYHSVDSMIIDLETRKTFLYGNAEVTYKDIELKADYIEIDFNKNEIFAKGLPDSTGQIAGKPVFTQGSENFEANTMRYNFRTGKGYIRGVVTKQEGGFLHSGITKKLQNGVFDIKNGKYTTCDAEHPHYYVALTKAKVVPGKEIVSGPAYMVIEDIPLPIAVPFGFFPVKQTHASGILIPSYGEEKNRGFYLRNGGYYFALNDYFDLSITGDVYTNGTWGVRVGSNYKKRYKFGGNFSVNYYKNVSGSLDVGNYVARNDYSVKWSHNQDPKANPTRTFRASVNLSSSSYDRNHSYEATDYLTNTKQSSVSFSKMWPGTPFNFSGSVSQSQNSQTRAVDLNLPKLAFTMNRIYPFKKKNSAGTHWYDNIDLTYNAILDNRIRTTDSLLFTSEVFNNMSNGFRQTIPLGVNFKPFNHFNVSPRIQYTGLLYTKYIEKHYTYNYDTAQAKYVSQLVTDTINKVTYAQSVRPSISMSLNPKIYGMFIFKNPHGKVEAIRHVMTPSVSFSYVPDLKDIMPDYYREITDTTTGRVMKYSIYEKEIYGTPTLPGRAAVVNFSLNNNLEMKVRTSSDTANNTRKVKLLESLNFNTNYNVFKDSLRWSPLSFNGRTSLWKNNIQLTFGGVFNPYALDTNGRVINTPNIAVSQNIFRMTNLNFSLNLHFTGGKKKPGGGASGRPSGGPGEMIGLESGTGPIDKNMVRQGQEETGYDYFNIPWDIRIRYNVNYSKPAFEPSIIQTLNVSGSFSLTPKWKISGNTGWDFKLNKLTYTSINIHRDLHCWEMSLSWIPIGYHQSYGFTINVKSSILKDLKYEKRKSWYDR